MYTVSDVTQQPLLPVMWCLETLPRLEAASRLNFQCLGLGLGLDHLCLGLVLGLD